MSEVSYSTVVKAMQSKSTLTAALAYHEAGLCVIPLRGKRPSLKSWKAYQAKPSSADDIRAWHKKGLLENVGLVCGKVSNNLVVIDFDGLGGCGAFAALFPQLTSTCTIRTGSGQGQHAYFHVEKLPPTTRALDTPIGHIELRSTGTYVVAPPSRHPVTGQAYEVEKALAIQRVPDLNDVVAWIESFKASKPHKTSWQPPHDLPVTESSLNPAIINAIADRLRQRRHKERGDWLNCSCIYPERHSNGDRKPSFGFNLQSGYAHCYRCGTMLAKDLCERLNINPRTYGGLLKENSSPVVVSSTATGSIPTPSPEEDPPEEDEPPPLSEIRLPGLLDKYIDWASRVGNQTPLMFHQGMGIWMASVAIARRLYVHAPWGVNIYPNLYMMFIAPTTFYKKTTGYKLGEQVLRASVKHMLMPDPGSPERFLDSLAGRQPGNFNQLSDRKKQEAELAMRFAAQRGLFRDEIAGLFGSMKRDYMAGLKDLILAAFDCPDDLAKETQSGLVQAEKVGLSILGVTTPIGLSSSLDRTDWDNGLLPRFALLTPEQDYKERLPLLKPEAPPPTIAEGLKALHEALPMPEKSGEGWTAPEALEMRVDCWQACQDYSDRLRGQCDPRLETPLDDRLMGLYGRQHVQAIKVAMICAALDWMENGQRSTPAVTLAHWHTGRTIAEHWRLSAQTLLNDLDRSVTARKEISIQEKILRAVRLAGPEGVRFRSIYRNHSIDPDRARKGAQELVRDGQIVPITLGRAEAYKAAQYAEEAKKCQ